MRAMPKDFDGWNKKKKKIHQTPFTGYIHEREIWWCSLGLIFPPNRGGDPGGRLLA